MENLTFSGVYRLPTKPGKFPGELKSGFVRSLDKRFVAFFFACFAAICPLTFFLSTLPPPTEVTQEEMEAIQERYAKLVLNKEIPKPEKKEEGVAKKAEKKKEEKAEKKEESVVERTERKEATKVDRAQKREALKKQIANVGIFAELTALGGAGAASSRSVRDLVGDVDATASLSNMNLSGASFVKQKAGEVASLRERRGSKTAAGTIEASGIGSAEVAAVKSNAKVEMNNVENLAGDAAGQETRSMKALNVVLREYQFRLQRVYERYLKRHPDLAGKLVIRFTIEPDGTVSGVKVVSSELNDPRLEDDLVRNFSRIKFAPATGKLTVDWPVVFSAG